MVMIDTPATPSDPTLFSLPPSRATGVALAEVPAVPATEDRSEGVRLRLAQRDQISWGRIDLGSTIPLEHPARIIGCLGRLGLGAVYGEIESRNEIAGAPAIDPKILLALWIFATSEGEGSAREIWRLTQVHDAYRWICGGVEVGCHTLSDFRSGKAKFIDELITQVLALLLKQDLVDLSRVAQDGTRVRASAGAASFRRTQTLETLMQEARAHLEAVTREALDPTISARRAAAIKRGAQERLGRLEEALRQVSEVVETKKRSGAKDSTVRVSTSDPQARVMKMGDGGYAEHAAIEHAADHGTMVYAPTPKPREGDSSVVGAWRQRMGTAEAKEIYKLRAATAETVNADAKCNRGLDHLVVRGWQKALA